MDCELAPSAGDADVLEAANREGRILITADLDFGDLVVRRGRRAVGVILLRSRTTAIERVTWFASIWPRASNSAFGHLVVVREARLRSRPL